jgi:hypothetical protein
LISTSDELPRLKVGSVLRDKNERRFVVKAVSRCFVPAFTVRKVATRPHTGFSAVIAHEPNPEPPMPHKQPRKKKIVELRRRVQELKKRVELFVKSNDCHDEKGEFCSTGYSNASGTKPQEFGRRVSIDEIQNSKDIVHHSKFMFHGTSSKFLNSIRRDGLKPGSFLAANPQTAWDMATYAAEQPGASGKPVVMAVRMSNLKDHTMLLDLTFGDKNSPGGIDPINMAVYVKEGIPAKSIEAKTYTESRLPKVKGEEDYWNRLAAMKPSSK